jgi:hypothetical protein
MVLIVLPLPGCRFYSAGSDLVENEIDKTNPPEILISPSQTVYPFQLTPIISPTSSSIPRTSSNQPPPNPSSAIKYHQLEKELASFCFYETHAIQIKDQTFTLLDFERCLTQNPLGEYSRKKSWWDYFETLKPLYSSFTWWRFAPGEDWAPAPLEYHDHIGIDMSRVINRVYDLDGWQITEEYLEVGDDKMLCWHYRYQGVFVGFPSNLIPKSEVEEKFWEDGFVNELQADVWIAPAGYIQRQIIQWDVNYRLSDGTTANGLEKISSELRNINQEIIIPEMVVPPVPSSLASIYIGKWLEYGDILEPWKYQVGKPPKETLAAYLQSEREGYIIQHLVGNTFDGFTLVIKDWSGLLWDVTIEPKETAKGGLVSVLVMVQK